MHQLEVISIADESALIDRIISDLTNEIDSLLTKQDTVHISLTGGRIGSQISVLLLNSPIAANTKVNFWWSDERFLMANDEQRNDLVIPDNLRSAQNIHRMPTGNDLVLETAVAQVQENLANLGQNQLMDICLLSIGPDGHVASLFPNHAALSTSELVVGISDSPKPPKLRITWSLNAINRSNQVWLIANGAEKSSAVTLVMAGAKDIPASNVHGLTKTVLYAEKSALLPK